MCLSLSARRCSCRSAGLGERRRLLVAVLMEAPARERGGAPLAAVLVLLLLRRCLRLAVVGLVDLLKVLAASGASAGRGGRGWSAADPCLAAAEPRLLIVLAWQPLSAR